MQELEAIPALSDNYVWALHDGRHAVIVDPGDAAPVRDWLRGHQLALAAILITHHHPDHIGGVAALTRDWPQARCWGPLDERVPDLDHAIGDGDRVELETPAAQFDVLAVPGHTRSHIAFHGEHVLFCGDTLFSAGCGRLFEGTPAQMRVSLNRLARLPEDTRVCCGHEYTAANLRFARHLEPDNADLAEHERWVREQRDAGRPSLPSRIDLERRINPFLRSDAEPVRGALIRERDLPESADPDQAFAALRAWKDEFRG